MKAKSILVVSMIVATPVLAAAPPDRMSYQSAAKQRRCSAGRHARHGAAVLGRGSCGHGGHHSLLAHAPLEGTEGASGPVEVTLPMPDGRLLRFAAVESPVLEPALQAQHPEIRT